ncbi:MAG: hypothetical protein AB1779_06885 [Candidatus Thermoplasmatota archaeon]
MKNRIHTICIFMIVVVLVSGCLGPSKRYDYGGVIANITLITNQSSINNTYYNFNATMNKLIENNFTILSYHVQESFGYELREVDDKGQFVCNVKGSLRFSNTTIKMYSKLSRKPILIYYDGDLPESKKTQIENEYQKDLQKIKYYNNITIDVLSKIYDVYVGDENYKPNEEYVAID